MAVYPVEITESLLQESTNRVVENFDPEKVILFGSRAVGTFHSESDVDLLIIMPSDVSPMERSIAVKQVARPRFVAMDVLVKTPDEVLAQLQEGNLFLQQILAEGRVLYERNA